MRTKVEILSPVARCQAEYSESQLILLLIPFSRTSAYAYMNIEGSINPWACACTSVLHTLWRWAGLSSSSKSLCSDRAGCAQERTPLTSLTSLVNQNSSRLHKRGTNPILERQKKWVRHLIREHENETKQKNANNHMKLSWPKSSDWQMSKHWSALSDPIRGLL